MYGSGRIFETGSVKFQEEKKERTANYIDAIITSAKTGSLDQFESNFNLLFNTIKNCSYDRILDILVHLAEAIIRIPTGLQPKNTNIRYENIEQIYSRIKGCENYEELKDWFSDLFQRTYNLITGLKNKKAADLFDITIKYINEYYYDSTLSASSLAEKLGITPQYFSKSFKQFIGMNFPDFINNIRLEKAKNMLLSNPLFSISDICEKTGYNSTSYFATAFTKKYGIPPSKYALSTKETTL
jgi:YesN/AraC family two-component response regulator